MEVKEISFQDVNQDAEFYIGNHIDLDGDIEFTIVNEGKRNYYWLNEGQAKKVIKHLSKLLSLTAPEEDKEEETLEEKYNNNPFKANF
ncbi:hypothetical protein [Christiangramia crocea]|uniref:Uncharacterized protein n=1 Tax=Christiangramia crocea TaxID=2904124 RepID=A0A9X2A500_9FLAO|nr:hypothetical protein [Gramella crocea]MCG9971009.1 hypothetical protein [Gramella crocea]